MPDRPLLVTGDADLLDHLVRLATAAGVETEVVQDVSAARRSWSSAPVVLVGADLVAAVARAGLPPGHAAPPCRGSRSMRRRCLDPENSTLRWGLPGRR